MDKILNNKEFTFRKINIKSFSEFSKKIKFNEIRSPEGRKSPKMLNLSNSYSVDSEGNIIFLLLFNSEIEDIIEEVFELKKLIGLAIIKCNLSHISKSIESLNRLKYLNLANNNISEIPQELYELKQLEILDLSYNKIINIHSRISNLGKLGELILVKNDITELPESILNIGPIWKNLAALIELNEKKNQAVRNQQYEKAADLRDDEHKLKLIGEGVVAFDNPLNVPPLEIIEQGRHAVVEYFKSLSNEENIPINELKILLVGEGGSGKTSLVRRLVANDFNENEPQTHGININQHHFKLNDNLIRGNFWDFGGQQIMHATHQFFLSKRSIYLIIVDSRKEEKVEYWLKLLEEILR